MPALWSCVTRQLAHGHDASQFFGNEYKVLRSCDAFISL